VKRPVALLPCASVAVHDTVVVATAKGEPAAGVQLGVTLPSTLSLADTVNVTGVVAPVASAVMFDGSVSVGAV
jgi:hypothetical protein